MSNENEIRFTTICANECLEKKIEKAAEHLEESEHFVVLCPHGSESLELRLFKIDCSSSIHVLNGDGKPSECGYIEPSVAYAISYAIKHQKAIYFKEYPMASTFYRIIDEIPDEITNLYEMHEFKHPAYHFHAAYIPNGEPINIL